MFSISRTAVAFFASFLLLDAAPAFAQEARGVTVTGSGSVAVAPDQLEIVATLRESAENADDVVVAFRDSRRRAVQSIEALGMDGLSVIGNGARLALVNPSQGGMAGMIVMGPGGGAQPPAIDPEYVLTETVTLRLAGFDEMDPDARLDAVAELLSACAEAGFDVAESSGDGLGRVMLMAQIRGGDDAGSGGAVRLTYSDRDAAIAQARAKAFTDARDQAEALAELAGIELGGVIGINSSRIAELAGFGLATGDNAADPDDEGRIVFRSTLTVTYAIE